MDETPLSMLLSSVDSGLVTLLKLMPLFDCGGVILSLPLPQSISDGVSVSLDISVVAGDEATEFAAGRFDVKSLETKHLGVVRPS